MGAAPTLTMSPRVSLTTFVDFVQTAGLARLRAVERAREEYDPASDYYKALRERIIAFHRKSTPLPTADGAWMGQLNPKKVNNYERCLTAHRRWVKKNAAEFREPIAGDWQASGLTVRVTPELGFRVDGKLYLAKLYLKGPAPTQWCRDATLQLMRNILPPGTEWTPAILDVQRGRLIADQPKSGLNVLLEAEAGVFAALWRGL